MSQLHQLPLIPRMCDSEENTVERRVKVYRPRPLPAAESDTARERRDARGRLIELRLIDQLQPHPLQSKFFRPLTEESIQSLADAINRHGLDPIEITPDNVIIAGHQRREAASLLGMPEVPVVVRHDLAAAGPEAVEDYFLGSNEDRRQLGPLERLAVIARRHQLEPRGAQRRGKGELRELIAAKMGLRLGFCCTLMASS